VKAEVGVKLRARRVEDSDDHGWDLEALRSELADDEVRVVAVRRNDDRVGLLDPGLTQDLHVHPMPDDIAALPVLTQPVERLLAFVDGGHVPPVAVELECDGRADSPATDHHCLHGRSVA
jgi:hypothetical protein